MAGYTCPESGHAMRHIEVSPGETRWECTATDCAWLTFEPVAARYLEERPDEPDFVPDLTRDALHAAVALPRGTFTVQGERSPQHPEGLTSEGERPAHVTNRPLGGDPEAAKKMTAYATEQGIVVTDRTIDALEAKLEIGRPWVADQQGARARAAKERQHEIEAGKQARDQATEAREREQAERAPQPTPRRENPDRPRGG